MPADADVASAAAALIRRHGASAAMAALIREAKHPQQRGNGNGSTVTERRRRTKAVAAWRQRRRLGLCVLKVPVVEYDVVQALIEAGRLTPAGALNRLEVEHSVAVILNEWAQHWLANSCTRG